MFHRSLTGADLHAPTNEQVENTTGSTILALKAVTYDGIGIAFPSIVLANGGADRVRGVTQADIVDNDTGLITALGFLYNVDTSAWTVGASLYADATGNLSTTPNGTVVVTVYKQHLTEGVMYVENAFMTGAGTGDVNGPFVSTDNAIARWDGTTGTLLQDSKALVQDGGGIEAQALMTNRVINELVTIRNNFTMLASNIEIEDGEIIIESDGELLIL